ncbi:MAG: iron ABC transporter permease [Acidimicrobiia bacterium]|nr:iron ABC transporter permease [Acidimicrobiia bacterium]MBT8192601.1 iron ABC transporter permease [Acidimicrobiia bacterium]NNF89608.1 iron ABC transporter permease [Acidimicrobiia bacterium]NNJ46573.1 iron ABC transporter permease [Acidimicrobiia bacterium]NNL13453.1 iron ABC transporter permease [Acidimicrobiia bacterium]
MISVGVLLLAAVGSLVLGPAGVSPWGAILETLDHIPFVAVDSGLSTQEAAIVWQIRVPRMVLAGLVGATLAGSGAAYQGVFRNPLADPYLLGVAAGAGLGATIAIVSGLPSSTIAPLAFTGAVIAVVAAYGLASLGGSRRSGATLILAGVAVAAFFTALQTYLQQQHADTIRQVFSWILGRLSTTGWGDVRTLLPYAIVSWLVLFAYRRHLDVMAVGEEEASTLGIHPARVRLVVVAGATLGAAAAVAVSGLIAFVGIIVPHIARLVTGPSHRVLLPVSLTGGAAFLMVADLVARTVQSGGEVPIGVITAFVGAPFFAFILATRREVAT